MEEFRPVELPYASRTACYATGSNCFNFGRLSSDCFPFDLSMQSVRLRQCVDRRHRRRTHDLGNPGQRKDDNEQSNACAGCDP